MEENSYTCTRCSSVLPREDFSWRNTDGRRYSICKRCSVEKVKEWRAQNPEKVKASGVRKRERIKADPDRHAREREYENALRRSKTRRGELVKDECTRCSQSFEYVFIQRGRGLCDLCRRYTSDWKKFGMTGPEAEEFRRQAKCEICGRTKDPGGRFNQWHIDHCHDSGKVRGLLCAPCNTVLGLMGNDPARLRAAAKYLLNKVSRPGPPSAA